MVLENLCWEICTKHLGPGNERSVDLTFVKSGYVMEVFLASFSDYVVNGNFIPERQTYKVTLPRKFESNAS